MLENQFAGLIDSIANLIETHDPVTITNKLDSIIPNPSVSNLATIDEMVLNSSKTFSLIFEENTGWLWF